MTRLSSVTAILVLSAAASSAARADVARDFSTNPLLDPSVLVQGPGAGQAAARFMYDGAAGTLTAHYDSTAPTVKLVFPLGQHFTQNNPFSVSAQIEIQSNGFVLPSQFGGEAPSFGLLNSTATGDARAATGFYDSSFLFHEVTPGTAYDLLAWDYFPTADQSFGGSGVSLTNVKPAQSGVMFNDSFGPGAFSSVNLPFDQFFNAGFAYDPTTHQATLTWGSGSVTRDFTGAVFDVDAFAITLWNDPNLSAEAPAERAGQPVAANVVFDSFVVVPEPATLAPLAAVPLQLLRRRRR